MSAFDDALALVLAEEGGRVNDRRDPGGRTNKGVTQTVYTSWRTGNGLPSRSVYLISPDEVATIYRHQYADNIRAGQFDVVNPAAGVFLGPDTDVLGLAFRDGTTPHNNAAGLTARAQMWAARLINHGASGA